MVECVSLFINFTRDPDVLPLLFSTNPSDISNFINSSKVKSFSNVKNLFISFCLVLTAMKIEIMYYETPIFFTINVEFVPPKPKELDRKVSKCLDTRFAGIFNRAESSSGFSKLMWGAIKPFFIISME